MYSKETFERHGRTPEPDATGSGDASAELSALVRELRTDLRSIFDSSKRIAFVEWQRLRLRAVDAFFRAAFCLGILCIVAASGIAAAVYFVIGLRGAMVAWSGVEWLADLVVSAVTLLAATVGCLAVRGWLHRRIVRKTRRGLAATPTARAGS